MEGPATLLEDKLTFVLLLLMESTQSYVVLNVGAALRNRYIADDEYITNIVVICGVM